jgi:hypothetical protein
VPWKSLSPVELLAADRLLSFLFVPAIIIAFFFVQFFVFL